MKKDIKEYTLQEVNAMPISKVKKLVMDYLMLECSYYVSIGENNRVFICLPHRSVSVQEITMQFCLDSMTAKQYPIARLFSVIEHIQPGVVYIRFF